jgi:hypothetical protein
MFAMENETKTFCDAVRRRSKENRTAMARIGHGGDAMSPSISILRQELDSMVRVIWLLSITNETERKRLIHATLSGRKWTAKTGRGKERTITDREMVNLARKFSITP